MVSVRLFRLRGVTCIGRASRRTLSFLFHVVQRIRSLPIWFSKGRMPLPRTTTYIHTCDAGLGNNATMSIQETMSLTTASQYFHGLHENHLWVMAGGTAAKELWCSTCALWIIRENGSEDIRATPSPDLPQHKSDAPHRDA